jgi:hypothetical protein
MPLISNAPIGLPAAANGATAATATTTAPARTVSLTAGDQITQVEDQARSGMKRDRIVGNPVMAVMDIIERTRIIIMKVRTVAKNPSIMIHAVVSVTNLYINFNLSKLSINKSF